MQDPIIYTPDRGSEAIFQGSGYNYYGSEGNINGSGAYFKGSDTNIIGSGPDFYKLLQEIRFGGIIFCKNSYPHPYLNTHLLFTSDPAATVFIQIQGNRIE